MKSKILPIVEDASFRTFYRLIIKKKSKIIVLAKKEKYKNLIAYSAINRFLRSNKIYVPKLYDHNFLIGIIVRFCSNSNIPICQNNFRNHLRALLPTT